MIKKPLYAHTPPKDQPTKWQTMREHCENVAEKAIRFSAPFGAQPLAYWAAWLHDVGKCSDEFQQYLLDCDAGIPRKPGSAEHKCAGTKLALEGIAFPEAMKKSIAACVLGHHGGLSVASRETLEDAVFRVEEETPGGVAMLETAITRAQKECPELGAVPPSVADVSALSALPQDPRLFWEMLTRFVFSCLVDADCLDTEHHFSEEKTQQRTVASPEGRLEGWRKDFQTKQQELMRKPSGSQSVNQVRRQVYEACLEAAKRPPGLFTLTVPTGGGKTRSVLAFALEHAAVHQHSETARRTRIIYAAPYTTIIDQTADVFREILGAEAVLEHHLAVEARESGSKSETEEDQTEDAKERKRQLLVQNWEVPLIVTTTVQLLESLFSDRTTRCRKLHNIAGSIIILDEVQTLPAGLLLPLLNGLRALLDQFGVTLVLCTATQPAITGDTPFRETLGEPTQIISDPDDHFEKLKRVTYSVEEERWDWTQTADKIQGKQSEGKQTSCLAVLNTKKDALALLDALSSDPPSETHLRHLSTLMCGAHRRYVLAEIKKFLEDAEQGGPAVILVSTQVIEAGTNIDFPHAFRAIGPLDRIIQTAGRCNREGKRQKEESQVVVFTPLEGSAPLGEYRTGIETALNVIRDGGAGFDFDTPTVATEYFASLYKSLGESGLDKEKVQALRLKHDFPEVARKMRLIKDDTVPVLVPYHQGLFPEAAITEENFREMVEDIRRIVAAQKAGHSKGKTLPRDLWQKIQPLTVAVFTTEIGKRPASELVPDQLYLWGGTYDALTGIGRSVDLDIGDLIIGSPKIA